MSNRLAAKSRTSAYSNFRRGSQTAEDNKFQPGTFSGSGSNFNAGSGFGANPMTSTSDSDSWGSSELVKQKTKAVAGQDTELKTDADQPKAPEPVADNPFVIKGSGSNNDEMYTSGKWGKGGMTPEAIAEKFGLDRSSAKNPDGGNKDSDIWGTDAKGNKVYIGTVTDESSLKGNSELLKAHSAQAHQDEGDHDKEGSELSSGGDINGALLNLWDGSGGDLPEPEAVDTEAPASQKLSKAQSYSQAYEDFRRSGGQVEVEAGNLGARDEFLDNYKLNLQRRMEPGVANEVGNDDLPAFNADRKRSNIAGQVVGKGAGFRQF